MNETIDEFDLRKYIQCSSKVVKALWNSQEKTYTLTILKSGNEQSLVQCRYVFLCTGYFNYEHGYTPEFLNREAYRGTIVHPQDWPEKLEYENKKLVIIGSGATAVTLLPHLVPKAKHVTMIQRSPSYILSIPIIDPFAKWLNNVLPQWMAFPIIRLHSIFMNMYMYWSCRHFPSYWKQELHGVAKSFLGDAPHLLKQFQPKYNPWEQRLCVVPEGDFYRAIRSDNAAVVTGQVMEYTANGVRMADSTEIEGDIIITATGLDLLPCGGIVFEKDGVAVDITTEVMYKGVMVSNMPNLFIGIGYTFTTWTVKCEVAAKYMCRMIRALQQRGQSVVTPHCPEKHTMQLRPVFSNLSSSFIHRNPKGSLKQGDRYPWIYNTSFTHDWFTLTYAPVCDNHVIFQ